MASEMIDLTVAQAADRIRTGELSADEYFEAYREVAAAESLNAFLWTAEAPQETGEGPLAGIPVAIKDIFCTEGIPTTAGSRILEGYRPPYTATAVRLLRQAGAPVLGQAEKGKVAVGAAEEKPRDGPPRQPRGTRPGPGRSPR